jgi:hypothetical protein
LNQSSLSSISGTWQGEMSNITMAKRRVNLRSRFSLSFSMATSTGTDGVSTSSR